MTFKQLISSVTKSEWVFVGILSLILIILTTAPVVYGFLITPEDKIFTAMHFVSADDWFVYYSAINQVREGNWLYHNYFSSLEHTPLFWSSWIAIGLLARIFDLSGPAAFHLARILLIPIFLATAYLFIAYLFTEVKQRKLSLTFLSFSSGLGVFLIYRLAVYPQNFAKGYFQWPMDLWVPDINTFLTLFTSPHFIAGTILILLIFLLTSLFAESKRYSYAVFSGLCGLVLFSFHPFQVIKIFAVILSFIVVVALASKKIPWHLFGYCLTFGLISSPSVFYYIWMVNNDFLTFIRTIQNINPTTPLYLTLVSFGGLFIFAVLGIYLLDKQKKLSDYRYLLVVVWAVVQFMVLYAPVNYQRRMALGIHFPLAILTLVSLFTLYQLYQLQIKKHLTTVIVVGLLLFLPSTFFAMSADIMVFNQGRELSYLEKDLYHGMLWLKKNSESSAVIFSDVKTGNVLPAYALRTSYVGHAVETPYFNQRKKEPVWFFQANRDQEIEKNFLTNREIDYVLYGPREQQHGNYNPFVKDYLKPVFSSGSVTIFKVI